MEIEKKSCDLELKDIDNTKGVVAFYFSPFNTPDAAKDEATPTAFDKTFSESKHRIKHFRNHDTKEVPGTIIELGKDTKGAYAISQLAVKTQVGLDTFEQYKAGIITEHSYGFKAIRAEAKSLGGRILKEVRLHEVSSLTAWGCSEFTPVISMKSLDDATEYLSKINNLLTSGNISDTLGERFEKEYKALSENINRIALELKNKAGAKKIDMNYLVKNFSA